jgi:hypothetical protein
MRRLPFRNLLTRLLRLVTLGTLLCGGAAGCGPIQLDFSGRDADASDASADAGPLDDAEGADAAFAPDGDSGSPLDGSDDASCSAWICDSDGGDGGESLDGSESFDGEIEASDDASSDGALDDALDPFDASVD